MPNLWEIITGNSTLPIQSGTTFWDHINNPKVGTGTGGVLPVFYKEISIEEFTPVELVLSTHDNELVIADVVNEIVIDENEIDVGEI